MKPALYRIDYNDIHGVRGRCCHTNDTIRLADSGSFVRHLHISIYFSTLQYIFHQIINKNWQVMVAGTVFSLEQSIPVQRSVRALLTNEFESHQ